MGRVQGGGNGEVLGQLPGVRVLMRWNGRGAKAGAVCIKKLGDAI